MSLLRIIDVEPLDGYSLQLTLNDDSVIVRDVGDLLRGPVFESIRNDRSVFAEARAENGSVVWPGGADLCPDVLIWGGMPPEEQSIPAATG